ncbi:SdpI family protein [bacterium D16-51]|nr:SdpI family protein [bacterium D16-59]RKI60943.1 SdpI family protein [bacterium D16-51]
MGFWIYMFLSNELVPILMLIFGRIFKKHPPKNINSLYGYRTSMSTKNIETWNFAHAYCGRLWWRIGLAMFLSTAAAMLPLIGKTMDEIGFWSSLIMIIQCAALIVSILPVERALRKNFDKTGKRISQ